MNGKFLVKKIDIYCDGACKGNPGPGGWGVYIRAEYDWRDDNKIDIFEYELCGGAEQTTNNIMEMTALVKAAEWLVINNLQKDIVVFHLDSAYIINCYMDGWWKSWQKNNWLNSAKKPVANKELWEKIIPLFTTPNFYFNKVSGHSGNEGNDKADLLANEGVAKYA